MATVIDAAGLPDLLAATFLAGRPVEELGFGRLLVRIQPEEVWPAWQAARSVVTASGRWPVAHTGWDPYVELTDVLPNPPDDGTTLTSALALDLSTAWHETWRDIPLTDEWIPGLVARYGLSEDQARGFVAQGALLDDVQRARLEQRVAAVAGDLDRIEVSPYLTDRDSLWFTPSGQATGIVFLTTDDPVAALADIDYFGGAGPALVAAGREWHEDYSAELVAAWGTMLQFIAPRRPVSLDDAWRLAGQQLRVGGSLQVDRDDLALALLRTDFWFLHERP